MNLGETFRGIEDVVNTACEHIESGLSRSILNADEIRDIAENLNQILMSVQMVIMSGGESALSEQENLEGIVLGARKSLNSCISMWRRKTDIAFQPLDAWQEKAPLTTEKKIEWGQLLLDLQERIFSLLDSLLQEKDFSTREKSSEVDSHEIPTVLIRIRDRLAMLSGALFEAHGKRVAEEGERAELYDRKLRDLLEADIHVLRDKLQNAGVSPEENHALFMAVQRLASPALVADFFQHLGTRVGNTLFIIEHVTGNDKSEEYPLFHLPEFHEFLESLSSQQGECSPLVRGMSFHATVTALQGMVELLHIDNIEEHVIQIVHALLEHLHEVGAQIVRFHHQDVHNLVISLLALVGNNFEFEDQNIIREIVLLLVQKAKSGFESMSGDPDRIAVVEKLFHSLGIDMELLSPDAP